MERRKVFCNISVQADLMTCAMQKKTVTPFGSVKSASSITGSTSCYAEATVLHNQIFHFLPLRIAIMPADFSRRHQIPLVKMTLQMHLKTMSSRFLTMHLKHPIQYTVMINYSGSANCQTESTSARRPKAGTQKN